MGGNIFPNVGAIHRNEVNPTINITCSELSLLTIKLLGSTGKKEFNNDIDLAVDENEVPDISELFARVKKRYGDNNVTKQGNRISFPVPIQLYSTVKHWPDDIKRTGFVQVDLIVGNIDWLAFYYHSPSEYQSDYKGSHRNQAMCALCSLTSVSESSVLDDFERPMVTMRWKWSPKTGLSRIERKTITSEQTGKQIKKQQDTYISSPYGTHIKDPNTIAEVLFHGKLGPEYFESLESIIKAVNIVYDDADMRERIFERMALYVTNNVRDKMVLPPELEKYNNNE